MEKMRAANEMLFSNKACPTCGARLAVCKKPINSASFPSLNIADPNIESEYYCPSCDEYFEGTAQLQPWKKTTPEKFSSDGEKHSFTKQFRSMMTKKTTIMTVILLAVVLPIAVYFFWNTLVDFRIMNWLLAVICGVGAVVVGYFTIYYYRMLRVCKRTYIELATKGVIFCNGAATEYIPWGDFRIGSVIDMGDAPCAFAFDTETTSFIVNANTEDYRALALNIADKIKDTAKLDPKILHFVYS